MNYFTSERLAEYMRQLQNFAPDGSGFDFHVHGIGDRGVQEILDAVEDTKSLQNSNNPPRHRITHLEQV